MRDAALRVLCMPGMCRGFSCQHPAAHAGVGEQQGGPEQAIVSSSTTSSCSSKRSSSIHHHRQCLGKAALLRINTVTLMTGAYLQPGAYMLCMYDEPACQLHSRPHRPVDQVYACSSAVL